MSSLLPPPGVLDRRQYTLRFAHSEDDVRAIQRLRFEVFNLELREGLEASYRTGRDEDAYDSICHHLMVIERATGAVVGTYRMQTAEMTAHAGRSLYAATEFDLSKLSRTVLERGVEVGRACVAAPHRTGRVIALLWQGLARYMAWHQRRYLFGCCSIPARSHAVGAQIYADLRAQKPELFSTVHHIQPLPALDCSRHAATGTTAAQDVESECSAISPELPGLFEGYIRLGAQLCGPPALDTMFGTVDFFMLLDLDSLDQRARRFFRDVGWEAPAEVPAPAPAAP